MNEFGAAAKELGLGANGADRLLGLHAKALRAQEDAYARAAEGWRTQVEREIPPSHLEDARGLLADPTMTPPEMREWLSGPAGNHPGLVKMLATWANAIARGRRD